VMELGIFCIHPCWSGFPFSVAGSQTILPLTDNHI